VRRQLVSGSVPVVGVLLLLLLLLLLMTVGTKIGYLMSQNKVKKWASRVGGIMMVMMKSAESMPTSPY